MPTAAIEARIAALSAETPEAPEAPADGEPSAPAAPPEANASADGTPSAPEGSSTPEASTPPDPDAEVRAKKIALLNEKLDRQREARRAARLEEQARADRAAAEADRQASAAERERWDAARKDYRKAFEAMGLSPREVYEEMTRQAVEADTPEAKLKAMQEAWKAELDQHVAPLRKTIEELQAERTALRQGAHDQALVNAFQGEIQDPAYVELRTEYEEKEILDLVRHFDKEPYAFYNAAKKYNVPLSTPDGFTMTEILQVLKAAQNEHNRGREQRRARLSPTNQSSAAQTAKPPLTVNGTAAGRNAETISNDLASSSASGGSRKLTRDERIEREIERLERR